jgi:hypothetical protein
MDQDRKNLFYGGRVVVGMMMIVGKRGVVL